MTTRATVRCGPTPPCRRRRSAPPAWPLSTAPNTPSSCSRRPTVAAADDDRFRPQETGEEELIGTRSEIITGPVADWATDFSHLEPEWSADPYPIQDDLRQRCPIAHTGRFGGGWRPPRYEDAAPIPYDTDHFSSRAIIMGNFRPPVDIAPIGGSPP